MNLVSVRVVNLFLYFMYILAYPSVLKFFNYMWKVNFEMNYLKLVSYSFGLIFLSNIKIRYLPILAFLILPVISLDTYTNELNSYVLIFSSLFWLIIMHFNFNLRTIKINFNKNIKKIIIFLSLFLIFYFLKNIKSYNPFLLLNDVYTFREENMFLGIEGYLINWLPTIVLPFLIFYFRNYKFLQFLIAIIVSVLIFLLTGVKSWLFLSIILLLPYYFSQKSIFLNFPLVVLLLLISLFFISNPFYLALMDRVLYVTPLYTLRYISYFSVHELMFFEDSKLGFFSPFDDKYNQSVGLLIDSEFGGNGMNANVGIIGSSFSDLGVFGLFFLTTFFIIFIGNIFVNRGSWALSLFLMYVYLASNAPPFDLILTHGLLVNLVLLFMIKSENQIEKNINEQKI